MKFCNKFARNKDDYKNIKEKTDVIIDAYRYGTTCMADFVCCVYQINPSRR